MQGKSPITSCLHNNSCAFLITSYVLRTVAAMVLFMLLGEYKRIDVRYYFISCGTKDLRMNLMLVSKPCDGM